MRPQRHWPLSQQYSMGGLNEVRPAQGWRGMCAPSRFRPLASEHRTRETRFSGTFSSPQEEPPQNHAWSWD